MLSVAPSTLFIPPGINVPAIAIEVPDGQWYRLLYLSWTFSTVATAGNRNFIYQVRDPSGNVVLASQSPAAQTPSVTCTYLVSPSVQAYTNTTVASQWFQSWPMPDLLWPAGYLLLFFEDIHPGADTFQANATVGVENYVEDTDARGATTLVPTPLLT